MKKLLSVVAILMLAGALLPGPSQADWRGAIGLITYPNPWPNGPDQIALRPGAVDGPDWNGEGQITESILTVTTRSLVAGSQSVREMYLYWNTSFAGEFAPILLDPAAQISYVDPAWSPDGKWLAYVLTDKNVTYAELYIQQFMLSGNDEWPPDFATAVTPVGSAVLVAGGGTGVLNRHPAWSPDGMSLAYDSNASGTSIDLYTIPVLDAMGNPALGSPARITFNSGKAEKEPAWSPDGTRIAYVSNEFGAFAPKILVLSTVPNPTDGYIADQNLFPVTYGDVSWSYVPGENVIYFSANAGGDPNSVSDTWRLDLNTQQKCSFNNGDTNGKFDPTVSRITNYSGTIPFNYVEWVQNAYGLGIVTWRSNRLQMCNEPLAMGVNFSPTTLNLGSGGPGSKLTVTLNFPPDVQAQGFEMKRCGGYSAGPEGILGTTSFYFPSPLLDGTRPPTLDTKSNPQAGTLEFYWSRRTIEAKAAALGLVNKLLPLPVTAYSCVTGTQFKGIGYLTVSTSSLAGSAIKMLQNSPNPFNPQTKITFAVNTPGKVEVKVFNVRGELVKTLAKQWYPQGEHTVTWDGRTDNGVGAPSGMYFAIAKSNGSTDKMKMMLMK